MLSIGMLTDLFGHMEWADAATWRVVLASASARTDAVLRERFYHMHVVQRSFLRMWRGEARDVPYPVFEYPWDLMRWAQSYYRDAIGHLAILGDEALSMTLTNPWTGMIERRIGRPPKDASIGESALQVVLHTNHHRGQIAALLHQAGSEPPMMDYIAWVWLGRPKPKWPSEPEVHAPR